METTAAGKIYPPMHQRTSRIDLKGDLDISRVHEVIDALTGLVEADRVVVSCIDATSMDSSFLTAMMRFRREFMSRGKDPHDIIIVVNPKMRRILEITGLVKTLTVVTSDPDATPA